MTIKEIVKAYLEANRYDGLYNICSVECACETGDLMPCNEPNENCTAGYKTEYKDNKCPCGEGCTWHIGKEKL